MTDVKGSGEAVENMLPLTLSFWVNDGHQVAPQVVSAVTKWGHKKGSSEEQHFLKTLVYCFVLNKTPRSIIFFYRSRHQLLV